MSDMVQIKVSKFNHQRGDLSRTTDFQKIDSLHYLADQNGLRIMLYIDQPGKCQVEYLKLSLAREPKRNECRDEQDYTLLMDAYIRACTVRSPVYDTFQEMVLGEIDRLNQQTL